MSLFGILIVIVRGRTRKGRKNWLPLVVPEDMKAKERNQKLVSSESLAVVG